MQSFDYEAMSPSSSASGSWFQRRPRQRRADDFGATGLTRPAKLALLSCMAMVGLVMIIVGVVYGSSGSVAGSHRGSSSRYAPTSGPTLEPTGPSTAPVPSPTTLFKPTPRPTRAPAPSPTSPAKTPSGACSTTWCEARGFGPDACGCGVCDTGGLCAGCLLNSQDRHC